MSSRSTKYTIITVCKDAEESIEKNLRSVANQTYENIEHVVIDGDSGDNTVSILEQFLSENSNLVFISEPDSGIYDAMNKGIRLAKGDILFFLNADDFFVDDKVIEDINKVFQNKEDLMLVYGDLIWATENQNFHVTQPALVSKKFLGRNTIFHQSIFSRKIVFRSTGEFSTKYKIVSDYEWMLKVFLKNEFNYQYIPRLITEVAASGISNTTNWEHERISAMRPYFSLIEIFRLRTAPKMIELMKRNGRKIKKKMKELFHE